YGTFQKQFSKFELHCLSGKGRAARIYKTQRNVRSLVMREPRRGDSLIIINHHQNAARIRHVSDIVGRSSDEVASPRSNAAVCHSPDNRLRNCSTGHESASGGLARTDIDTIISADCPRQMLYDSIDDDHFRDLVDALRWETSARNESVPE